MPVDSCRVCGAVFFEEPLLEFRNMPKAAQNFPDDSTISQDTGVELKVYQCKGCGLVQLNNDPVSYYKEVIRAAAFSEEMRDFRVEQFKNFVNKYGLKDKKVVEIGCGKGEFLSLMSEAETKAFGIEFGDESVAVCHREGLSVSKFYIESDKDILEGGPFDCFFIMNFFEHLPDPNTTLKALYNNLTDDGLGLVEVPNFDMILDNSLFSEFINDHLFYFTRETLGSTLARNGFEIVECEEVWYKYIISAVVRKRKRLDTSSFYKQQNKIKNDIQEFVSRHGYGRVAVYGAGHQALAIISIANIGDAIRYVVDDAPFKQGKYTPATHVPIVSSKHLEEDPVDAIIIMAASYSDEVAGKLKQKPLNNVEITILRDYGLEGVRA